MPERPTLFGAVRKVAPRRTWRADLPGWDVWPAHKGETCVSPDEHHTTYFIRVQRGGLFRLTNFHGATLVHHATRDEVVAVLNQLHPKVTS